MDKSSNEILDLSFVNKELQNYVKSKEDYRIHFGVFESQLRWDNFKKKCPSDKLQILKGKYLEFCDIVAKYIHFIYCINRITELHGSKLNESCLFMFQQALDTYTGKGAVLRLYPNIPPKDWESLTQLATILNAYYSTIEAPLSHIPKSNKLYGIHLPYMCPHNGVAMNQISSTSSEDSNEISTNRSSEGMSISEVQSVISNASNVSNPAYNQSQTLQQQENDFLYGLIKTYIAEQNLDIKIDELISDIINILESSPSSEVLQEPLVNLLGYNFELIETLIDSRDYILENFKNNNNNNSNSQYKPFISAPPSVTLPSYSVTTESEIKQRKEEHKVYNII